MSWSPKESGDRGHREKVSFDYPSLGITSAGISLASSSVCALAVTPTGMCPDDHYLIVIADDLLVVSDAILAIVVILWGRFAALVHPT